MTSSTLKRNSLERELELISVSILESRTSLYVWAFPEIPVGVFHHDEREEIEVRHKHQLALCHFSFTQSRTLALCDRYRRMIHVVLLQKAHNVAIFPRHGAGAAYSMFLTGLRCNRLSFSCNFNSSFKLMPPGIRLKIATGCLSKYIAVKMIYFRLTST